MPVCIIGLADLAQWRAEEVTHRNALADVQIPKRIKMDAPRLAQILVRTFRELRPGPLGGFGDEFLCGSPAIHDGGFTQGKLADRQRRIGILGLCDAHQPKGDAQLLRCRSARFALDG